MKTKQSSGLVVPLDTGEDGWFFALGSQVDAQGLVLYVDGEFLDDRPSDAGC